MQFPAHRPSLPPGGALQVAQQQLPTFGVCLLMLCASPGLVGPNLSCPINLDEMFVYAFRVLYSGKEPKALKNGKFSLFSALKKHLSQGGVPIECM